MSPGSKLKAENGTATGIPNTQYRAEYAMLNPVQLYVRTLQSYLIHQ